MGKLLEILGVKNQEGLDKDIFVAEELIVGMQEIYKNSPESYKKEKLANTIAELVRIMMQQIKGLPLTTMTPTLNISDLSIEVGCVYTYQDNTAMKTEGFYVASKNNDRYIVYHTKEINNTNKVTLSESTLKRNLESAGTKVKLVKGGWYKGEIRLSSGSPLPYLYKFKENIGISSGYMNTDCYILFWAKAMALSSDFTNIEALAFSKPATEQEVVDEFMETIQTTFKDMFVNGQLKVGAKLRVEINYGFGEIEITPQTSIVVELGQGEESPTVRFYQDGTPDLYIYKDYTMSKITVLDTGKKFEEDKWYIIEGKNRIFQSTGETERVDRSNGAHFYKVYYSVMITNSIINAEFRKNDYFANNEFYDSSRKATMSELENFLRLSCELNGLVGGVQVSNTNIGGGDTSATIQLVYNSYLYTTQADDNRLLVDFSGVGGLIKVFDSYHGFAKVVSNTTTARPTRATRRSARPSPDISANDVAEGTRMQGNDGNMYVARKTTKGYNQWKKVQN